MPEHLNYSFWSLIKIALLVAIIYFLIDGYLFNGFLKTAIVLNSNAFDSKIIIECGDLFKQDGWKVIPVNEFFDSTVDDKHVSSLSLHGILMNKYWSGETEDWDKQVKNSLHDTKFENITRTSGKTEKYPLGSTAIVQKDDNKFLCVALAKTNTNTLEASTSLSEFNASLTGLLKKSREACSGFPLNIPLLGSGLSKTNIKQKVLINLILLAIFEESKKGKITDEIRIIIHKSKKKDINLNIIEKNWS